MTTYQVRLPDVVAQALIDHASYTGLTLKATPVDNDNRRTITFDQRTHDALTGLGRQFAGTITGGILWSGGVPYPVTEATP